MPPGHVEDPAGAAQSGRGATAMAGIPKRKKVALRARQPERAPGRDQEVAEEAERETLAELALVARSQVLGLFL